ncbi:MAG: PIN domain-containing protein [Chloroflexi bacterium]|nr:PIN domain-containing protein [Chloroflexota bacterium]
MESLIAALRAHPCIALHSSVLVYYFEAHPDYGPLSRVVMREVADGLPAVTTTLTLMDALVMPLRLKNQEQYERHHSVLTTFLNLRLLPIDQAVVEQAAALRARAPRLSTPDALTIAVGRAHGATLYVINDARTVHGAEMDVLNLRDVQP